MASRLDGVFLPVPTPYRDDEVAPDRLAANLGRWNRTGLAGYVVLGATGECTMLAEAERDRVLAAAREAVPRERRLIAGTGAGSTLHTIRQTRRAAALGADVASVVTPRAATRGAGQDGAQVRHYLAVAEASPIPVLVCTDPLDTRTGLDPETVAAIAAHPNVCGIEDASGNVAWAAEIIDQTPKAFDVLVGAAGALLPALAIGATGGVLALAALAPRELCEVYELAIEGRWSEARDVARRMLTADRGVLGRYGIGGLKAGLDLQGLYGGPCRPPLGTPDGDAIDDIKEVLATAGLL